MPGTPRTPRRVQQPSLLTFFGSPAANSVKSANRNNLPLLQEGNVAKPSQSQQSSQETIAMLDEEDLAMLDDIENSARATRSTIKVPSLSKSFAQSSSSSDKLLIQKLSGRGSGSKGRGVKRIIQADSEDEDSDAATKQGPASPLAARSSNQFRDFIKKKRQKVGTKSRRIQDSDAEDDEDYDNDHASSNADDDADDDFRPLEDDGSDEEVMVEVKATPSRAGSRRRPVLDKTDSNVPLRFSAYALPAAGANSTPDVEESRSAPSTPRNSRQPKLPSNFNGDATPSRRPPSAAPDTVKKSTKDEVRYPWLENPLDAQRRKPTDPDYDKQTLYIPPSAWAKFTPFEKQFWEIKSKYWDTIVFFKKGSFYEMYDKDAFIAHQEFDLRKSDRINMAMSGVPESSFEHWASKFIAKGYKIAKVDQMETSIGKTMRERGSSQKAENIIRRELTAVLTAGTLVDPKMLTHDLATYCMAIVEAWPDSGDTEPRGPSFGIAFVDAATAQFWLCTIHNDNEHRAQLETLLVQIHPREIIYVLGGTRPTASFGLASSSLSDVTKVSCDGMGGLTPATLRVLKNNCPSQTLWNGLKPRMDFWDHLTTAHELESAGYFEQRDGQTVWPETLAKARESSPLELSAVGGLVSYLRSLKLDKELVSLGNFNHYLPVRQATSLVLDGPTMSNLDLFTISSDTLSGGSASFAAHNPSAGVQEGTLFALINHAITPFGKRLLRRWMCHPLRHVDAINERLDVVDTLIANPELSGRIQEGLHRLPDMERLLSRIHAGSCKVKDWICLLDSLDTITQLMHMLGEQDEVKQAKRLNFLVRSYPAELPALLDKFRHGFDRKLAETEGTIIPTPGLDEEYDQAREAVAEIEQWLDGHLKEHQKRYHCPSLTYKHIGKEHYQLEFPLSVQPPDNYVRLSATKKVHRYWSPELIKKVRAHAEALETETMALRRVQSRIYALFDRSYSTWMKAIQIAAEVDALRSLAYASVSMGAPYCRPIFVDPDAHGSDGDGAGPVGRAGGYLEFRELRHPCVALAASQGSRDFVPNDVVLGTRPQDLEHPAGVDFGGGEEDNDGATMILLTGPNMGGKSTLLRQVCLGIILAQLGCYVPASYAALTPVDRLFTRLGARDHLLSGQSTFMVELAETSTLLHHATPRSFVAVDELGRGTSTHDGEAVAYGVLHSISSRLGCLGIFSTHYGMLADGLGCVEHGTSPVAGATAGAPSPQEEDSVEQGILPNAKMSVEPHVRPMHMACAVDDDARRVTFLYKLNRGIAPRSHGMNVAAMAGVPLDVVKRAEVVAEKFEHGVKARIESRRAQKQQAVALDQSRQMPLTLQSDFANLLRLAKMTHAKADSSAAEFVSRQNPALLDRVGGVNALAEFNENQYWGCVIDHISQSIKNFKLATASAPAAD